MIQEHVKIRIETWQQRTARARRAGITTADTHPGNDTAIAELHLITSYMMRSNYDKNYLKEVKQHVAAAMVDMVYGELKKELHEFFMMAMRSSAFNPMEYDILRQKFDKVVSMIDYRHVPIETEDIKR